MGYSDLSECTLTDEERLAEAERIARILSDDPEESFSPRERTFLEQVGNGIKFVSIKQLFWLRDILAKHQ